MKYIANKKLALKLHNKTKLPIDACVKILHKVNNNYTEALALVRKKLK